MPRDITGKEVKVGDIVYYTALSGNNNWGYKIIWHQLQIIKIRSNMIMDVVDTQGNQKFIGDDTNFIIVGHKPLHDYQFADNI